MKRAVVWAISIATLGLVVLVASTVVDGSGEQPPGVDFIGEVATVTFDAGWEVNGGILGGDGPDSPITVGPQTVTLQGGDVLVIPSGTPGGNLCLKLIHPDQVSDIAGDPSVTNVNEVPMLEGWWDWRIPCVVMGEFDDAGEVAWFEVLAVSDFRGAELAEVGQVESVDFEQDSVVTADGFRFVPATNRSDCGAGLDEVTTLEAMADWTTGEVIGLECGFG